MFSFGEWLVVSGGLFCLLCLAILYGIERLERQFEMGDIPGDLRGERLEYATDPEDFIVLDDDDALAGLPLETTASAPAAE